MSMTIADLIARSQAELIAELGEPTVVVCYSCGCSFDCYKPLEEISDSECCGMDDCCGEPEDWT